MRIPSGLVLALLESSCVIDVGTLPPPHVPDRFKIGGASESQTHRKGLKTVAHNCKLSRASFLSFS